MEKELTCIRCPIGCQLKVLIEKDQISVTGNTCSRGKEYGIKEVTNPTRVVTSSIRIDDGMFPIVSVKTNKDIPKDMVFPAMEEIHHTSVSAPVHIGDILISNVANTGSDIVATRNVERI